MSCARYLSVTALLLASALEARAADEPAPKPIRVLLVCGGCCHDYTRQKVLIAEGLAERAQIEVTAIQQGGTTTNTKIPLYENANWSKGYDLVIHDECFSDAKDTSWTARILAPHKAGLPAVVLHCAMHSYRDGTDEWFKFCGVTSRRHGAGYPHEVLNRDPAHSIMKEFGPAWANPAGELYWIEKVWPTTHPLGSSKNKENGHDEVCVWTNDYGKARVFGTTLGHHNETVGNKVYLDMLTRGVLWAVDKLEPRYLKTIRGDGPKAGLIVPSARTEASYLEGVKIPEGYDATVFAAPPAINYPVFVSATPRGDLYVSADRNGSLDREKARGTVYRLRDINGDGRADEVKRFVADIDSPRGLVFDRDRLYLMHPPHLSAFIDKDGDGIAEEQKVLVKNIGFGYKDRPGNHTSNGVTLGIDGWLYLAIGDFGFVQAEGTDGRKLQLRGGVVRVRPDGTGMELFSRGTRNILETSIDPLLNIFARDNTNDGGGWDIRLHHFTGMKDHGYPRLFKNFPDETIAPLADYGGGSGCGGLYLSEPGFPNGDGDALYTADWGRDRVFRHKLTPSGATFAADQTDFLTVPRVTDLDVDAIGHLYVSSWKGATFTFAGEDVGFLLRVTPKGMKPEPLCDSTKLDVAELVKALESPSHRRRLEAQRELLDRGIDKPTSDALLRLASDEHKSLKIRVAAMFTLKRGLGPRSTAMMVRLVSAPSIREFALRALTDRLDEWKDVPASPIVAALVDNDPRVRRQAAVSLSRLGDVEHAQTLTSLLGDRDPTVAHTAVQSLIALKAVDACFAVVDRSDSSPSARTGALCVLQALHDPKVADGLSRRLDAETSPARRLDLIAAMARLDHREGYWRGDGWGTRPDTSGPYYQPEVWDASATIEPTLRSSLEKSNGDEFGRILRELDRNKVIVKGMTEGVIARASNDPGLVTAAVEHFARVRDVPSTAIAFLARAADPAKGRPASLRSESTIALIHASGDDGIRAALAALVQLESIGRDKAEFRLARDAFLGSQRLGSYRGLFESLATDRENPASVWANCALLVLSGKKRGSAEARGQATRSIEAGWADPSRREQILRAVALAQHQPSANRVLASLSDSDPAVASAAREAARQLKLGPSAGVSHPTGPRIETLPIDRILNRILTLKGDIGTGERLLTRLSCVNCHTVRSTDPAKGPYLGAIATTYKRREPAEAILQPSKTIAQGFTTHIFALEDGRTLTGFVVSESADRVILRDGEGKEIEVSTSTIVDRAQSSISVMPEGLVKDITVGEFASLLDYLESLSKGTAVQ